MVYESSYESGRTPFVPDTKRGYWAQPSDFIYACLGLAFKMDIFSMAWFFFFEMGIFAIIPYLICMALYVVPLFVIQSFLGQFSSSGFVSALRISPLFKGMGYISIGLNLSILTYIGIYGAIPLFYLVHSFRPTLPWSCEAFLKWSADAPMAHDLTLCNSTFDFEMKLNEPIEKWLNDVSSPNATTTTTPSSIEETTPYVYDEMRDIYEYRLFQIPSIMFFRSLFADYQFLYPDRPGKLHFYISWELVISMFATWSIVALIFWKASTVEKMGKLIRYTVWLILTLLTICLIRFVFLPGAREALHTYFIPRLQDIGVGMAITPFFAASSFGAGWGAIISLSSYNKFNTNIMRYGWYICAGQMMIMVTFGFLSFLIEKHFVEITGNTFMDFMESHWIMFLSSGSALANMEVPNLWCILFYTVLTLSALLVMHGLTFFPALTADGFFAQTLLNLLLLLVVLWIYGRVRFQRDIEFMLGQRFSTWRINILRFVAPLGMLLTLLICATMAYFQHYLSTVIMIIIALIFIGIPWIFVPGYAAFSLVQTTGTFLARWKRCCHPTDWYPVEAEDRQRYEEAMGNMDITHQLKEIREEEA